ncbi:hypothetical protein A2W32_00830 [candidate division WWE3 bacterium RBG_16_37_10]|uniref:Dipeptidylpeptidase IV N-terminal domain-containing protein n=1 Tax=candidate division WWE3 bacterium RBG_16_37_10 TaxID=1802610 RepID=A0A1F4V206_UNCKA|nr:MAG: hypothetical protein A2W32_00830 [candidate division WWE3 bacterium RBG_16_37_10]
MKKSILIIFFILLSVTVGAKLSNSSKASSSTNVIDIASLNLSDFMYLDNYKHNYVFLSRNGDYRQIYYNGMPIRSISLSPSQERIGLLYLPNSQSTEELSLTVMERKTGIAKEIFHTHFASWDVRGDLHWLGDDRLFFLRHCGTSCRGITLLSVKTGETSTAVLTYPSFPNQKAATSFKDWSGKEYPIEGLVSNIDSRIIDSQSYIVFDVVDEKGNPMDDFLLSY